MDDGLVESATVQTRRKVKARFITSVHLRLGKIIPIYMLLESCRRRLLVKIRILPHATHDVSHSNSTKRLLGAHMRYDSKSVMLSENS